MSTPPPQAHPKPLTNLFKPRAYKQQFTVSCWNMYTLIKFSYAVAIQG